MSIQLTTGGSEYPSLRLVRVELDDANCTATLCLDELTIATPQNRVLGTYRYDKGIGIRPVWFDLPYEEAQKMLSALSAIRLSPIPPVGPRVIDGGSMILRVVAGTNAVEFHSSMMKDEWSAFNPIVSVLCAYSSRLPEPEDPTVRLRCNRPEWLRNVDDIVATINKKPS